MENRFDKIIAEKLSAATDYSADPTMWKAIESALPNAATGSNGFNTSLISGLAAASLLGLLFTSLPNIDAIQQTQDNAQSVNNSITHEPAMVGSTEQGLKDAPTSFVPQESHEIEFVSSEISEAPTTVALVQKNDVTTNKSSQPTKEEKQQTKQQNIPPSSNPATSEGNIAYDFTATGIQCAGGEISFTSKYDADEIQWIFDGVVVKEGRQTSITFEEDGTHEAVMLIHQEGKSFSVKKEIEIFGKPTPSSSFEIVESEKCFQQVVRMHADPGSNTYEWTIGESQVAGANAQAKLISGLYDARLKSVNQHGCVSETSHAVSVEGGLAIFIPNSFTPDNNGSNDEWFPAGLEKCSQFNLRIFKFEDRSKVYETTELEPWTGSISGTSERPKHGDRFFYEVIATDQCGYSKKYSGLITVL